MLTRGSLLVHGVILLLALQALHNVVNIAKFLVVETNPMSTFLGDFLVSIDHLLDYKDPLKEFLPHLPLPEVVLRLRCSHTTFFCITRKNFLNSLA